MSKWYWFFDCLKLAFMSLLTKEDVSRHWVISEDRLEHYQNLEKEYKLVVAEKEMWFNIAQTNSEKLQYTIGWINENWKVKNEKQSV